MTSPFSIALSAAPALLHIETARNIIGVSAAQMVDLIEDLRLGYVFEIHGGAAPTRREIRVWKQSLIDYIEEPERAWRQYIGSDAGQALAAIQRILPCTPQLSTADLSRTFSCSITLIHALTDGGQLVAVNERLWQPGTCQRITRASAVEFLRRRRLS